MDAERSVILCRIDHWDEYYYEIGNRCSQVDDFDFKFVVDESNKAVDTHGFEKISVSTSQFEQLGFVVDEFAVDPTWYNRDYPLYVAFLRFPQYRYYWVIEQGTVINFGDYNEFFGAFRHNHIDFLGTVLRRAEPDWVWYDAAKQYLDKVWSAFWPVLRLSNRAVAYAFTNRLIAGHRYRSENAGLGRGAWPFCEAWLASVLCNSPNLSVADLNKLMVCYNHPYGGYGLQPKRRHDLLTQPADQMLYFPALGDAAYLETIFEEHRSKLAAGDRLAYGRFLQTLSHCREVSENATRCRALAGASANLIGAFDTARITRGDLLEKGEWWLGHGDGSTVADELYFSSDSTVLGDAANGEGHWSLKNGQLILQIAGKPLIVFDEASRSDDGLAMRGCEDGGDHIYILNRQGFGDVPYVAPERPAGISRKRRKSSAHHPKITHSTTSARRGQTPEAPSLRLISETIADASERVVELKKLLAPLFPERLTRLGQPPTPLVSIVLPVYNQADLVEEAVDSILAQSYKKWELIIVDDGSSDDLTARIRRFRDDRRILLLRQENQKLPAALNNGFRFARGELLTWTSADNIMLPGNIERLVYALETHPNAGLAYSDYWAIDDNGQPLEDPGWRPHNRDREMPSLFRLPSAVSIDNFHKSGDNFIGASFMYRRELAELTGEYNDEAFGGEDYDYWLRMHLATEFCHVRVPLYKYRVHENSLSARAGELGLFRNFEEIREMARWRLDNLLAERSLASSNSLLRPAEQFPSAILAHCRAIPYSEIAGYVTGEEGVPVIVSIDVPLRSVDLARVTGVDILLCRSDLVYNLLRREPRMRGVRVLRWDGEQIGRPEAHAFIQAIAEKASTATRRSGRRNPAKIDPAFVPSRILHLVDVWSSGGLENIVVDLCKQLYREGRSLFLAAARGPAPPAIECADGSVIQGLSFAGDEVAFTAFLIDHHIEVVNYHHCSFGIQAAKQRQITTIYTMHNSDIWFDEQTRSTARAGLAAVDGLIGVSRQVAQFAASQYQVPAERIAVVCNGLPDEIGFSGPRQPKIGTPFRVLMVGSFVQLKLQHVAIAAFSEVADQIPELHLRLIGARIDNNYAPALHAQIMNSPHRDRIEVLAGLSRAETFDQLMQAHVFMLPSSVEGWSLAMMEAIAAGCVCIASDVGGARDLHVEGGSVVIVPAPLGELDGLSSAAFFRMIATDLPRHQAHLAEALRRVWRQYHAFSAGVARTQTQLRELCSMAQMADGYLDVYSRTHRQFAAPASTAG